MKKITFILLLAICCQYMIYAQESSIRDYRYTVHFDLDNDQMNSHAKLSLEKRLAEYLGKEVSAISIIGHTDMQGNDDYNINLSKRRSENIQNFLAQNGFGHIATDISYQGENQLHSLGESKTSHASNRRVEIWFYIQEKELEAKKGWTEVSRTTSLPDYDEIIFPKKEIKKRELSNYEKFHQDIDVETQYFNIDHNKNVIEGKKGTIIYFEENSFCDCETKEGIQGNVQLELKEYYSMGDFMRGGLSTMNNDKILQSGGTINLIAKKDEKEICLKDRQEYQIFFPKNKMNEEVYPDMQLFTGNMQEDGTVNWGVMAKNTLKNRDVLEYQMNYPNGCYKKPYSVEIKWNFFKRTNKFIFRHQQWKFYKIRRSDRAVKQIIRANEKNMFRYQICLQEKEDALNGIKRSHEEMFQFLQSKYDTEKLLFDYYFTSSTGMAKINLDRFYKKYENREITIVDLPLDVKDKVVARAICKKDNVIFNATKNQDGQFSFLGIPKGLRIKIVAYDYSLTEPRLAVIHTKSGNTISSDQLQLETCTKEEFKEKIISL